MKTFLSFLFLLVTTSLLVAQNPPVAVNDTAITMSEQTVEINVLLNDFDPDGDEIEIKNVRQPEHGEIDLIDDVLYYTSEYYVGWDSLEYRIREVDDQSSVSEYAWVFFNVIENPDIPIAVDDNEEVLQLVPTELNTLVNDSDPNGDEFVIYNIQKIDGYFNIDLTEDSLSVTVTTKYPLECSFATFRYRIKEKNTENEYYSDWATVTIDILENTDIPTAIDDVANTTGGEAIDVFVLENDINPSSSQLEIESAGGSDLGSVEIIDNHIRYTPNFSEYGIDAISYKIRLADKPFLYDNGEVIVDVANNPGKPIAVDDTGNGVCGGETIVEVLSNDYDPEGEEIEIKDVRVNYPSSVTAHIQGNLIEVITIFQEDIHINSEKVQLEYRVQEIDNPDSYSEWATIAIDMEQNTDYPILGNDYANALAGYPVEIDIFANDEFNGYGTYVSVYHIGPLGIGRVTEEGYSYTPYMTSKGIAKFVTMAAGFNDGYISFAEMEINIEPNHSYDSLDINNINAGIHSDGYLFAKVYEVIGIESWVFGPHFEYPKGSGKHSIFSNSLWIGGVDQNDSLHLAAQRYKQEGIDFQTGPISEDYEGLDFFSKWSRVWKVSKDDIYYHRHNYWKEAYEPVNAIINWPGNGDASNGQAEQLAAYFDTNENGIYEPMQGDYPLIRGDQSILFIYNDDRLHFETDGGSMQVEIHGMAYAYDEPSDELLNNTVFVHYDIYNRSENTYYDTYLGTWTDIDLGYAYDDYVGSNVELGSYFGYNGQFVDGSGEPEAYGVNSPAQSITIVAGPYMDADETDNPDGGCNYSVNGLNFGDGIVDNERFGMIRFIYNNNSGGAQGDPQIAPQYYNYLKGLWKDNTSIMYGGTGHESFPGTVGPECSFMFPGASDPCNWGTNGVLPNDGYNQDGKYWTEETGNNGTPNPAGDRRGLGVAGPFTFEPGDMQELELAFSVGQGDEGPLSSVQQLFENLEDLFQMVEDGQIIIPTDQLSVDEQEGNKVNLKVYPNPVKDFVYVELEGDLDDELEYKVFNNFGNVVMTGQISTNIKNTIDLQKLEQGFYIIKVQKQGVAYSGRFIKM